MLPKETLERLQTTADALDRLNSAFPETRKFLEARGLTRVSELDEAGRLALVQHLRETLAVQQQVNAETAVFLRERGLESVGQLDDAGRAALAERLKKFSRTC